METSQLRKGLFFGSRPDLWSISVCTPYHGCIIAQKPLPTVDEKPGRAAYLLFCLPLHRLLLYALQHMTVLPSILAVIYQLFKSPHKSSEKGKLSIVRSGVTAASNKHQWGRTTHTHRQSLQHGYTRAAVTQGG